MRPQRPGAADASGMAAGFLLLSAIIGCAAIGALIGWPLGIPLPLALAGRGGRHRAGLLSRVGAVVPSTVTR